MRRRATWAAAGLVVIACVALGVDRVASRSAPPASNGAGHAASSSTAPATPSATIAALNPLTIAAMRARSYPASILTPVRSDGDQGGYVTSVVSFVSDGLTEYALMSVPDGKRPAAGWPVVIISHGYIDPRTYRTDDGSYAQFIATLARARYLVLKPDYRGHGQSQGVPEGGYLTPVYTYDLLNLISTVKADPLADKTRIGLFGHSLGAYEVLRAMVVSPDIRAVVLMAGVVGSLYDIFYNWNTKNATPAAPPPVVQQQVAQSVIAGNGTPQTNPDFWNQASPINYVDDVTAATQINQDVGDTVVPKLFSDHLDAALVAAGKSVEYDRYPGDDHQFIRNRTAILAHMLAFYRLHL
jgi:dipeptidyl aminopeptidase/acylaminoacyl peptidase